jgi:hypothetical protein
MRKQDFGDRVAALYTETVGGKKLYVAGHTAMRQAVIIGSTIEDSDVGPLLFAVHAPITEETGDNERLQVALFQADPAAGEVRWQSIGARTRVTLHSGASATRLVLPGSGNELRYIFDGALLTPTSDMIPGIQQPPQQLPASLEALRTELAQPPAPPVLRVVA